MSSIPCPPPRGTSVWLREGRYPGSQVLMDRLPRLFAQWHFDPPSLAYRCGGSTGMVFVNTHLFPV